MKYIRMDRRTQSIYNNKMILCSPLRPRRFSRPAITTAPPDWPNPIEWDSSYLWVDEGLMGIQSIGDCARITESTPIIGHYQRNKVNFNVTNFMACQLFVKQFNWVGPECSPSHAHSVAVVIPSTSCWWPLFIYIMNDIVLCPPIFTLSFSPSYHPPNMHFDAI